MKADILQTVTNSIIEAIENMPKGESFVLPWTQSNNFPVNALTKKHYRGGNILSLWAAGMVKGYTSPHWATFKQWAELGAQVKKGEKASHIVFWNTLKTEPANDGEDQETRMFARASMVFNSEQVEGWTPPAIEERPMFDRIAYAEKVVSATGADIRKSAMGAFYHRSQDYIGMPEALSFIDTKTSTAQENYYSTLFHELTHWTGAENRLSRTKGKKFGDEAYAYEELVAELGAAFLCAATGISAEPRADHAQYLASWLKALKNDKSFLFSAASQSQKALDFILGFSIELSETTEEEEAA